MGNNTISGDGCSSTCFNEVGFRCFQAQNGVSVCNSVCGDGFVTNMEECDDGNDNDSDGCTNQCIISSSSNGTDATVFLAVIIPLVFIVCCITIIAGILAFLYAQKADDTPVSLPVYEDNGIQVLKNIEVGEILGKGEFGVVYKGEWEGKDVALKSLNGQKIDEFINEMKLLLEANGNPNVLEFFGIFFLHKEEYMVTEFMDKADMLHFLRGEDEITFHHLFEFAIAIAAGMGYLHSLKIIHRDLAARNVLIKTGKSQNEYIPKISDFGLSRKTNYYYQTNNRLIPVRWTAPEALIWSKFSKETDVWSFGVVLFEIFSRGAVPYAGISNQKVLHKVTKQGYRLTPPREMPPAVATLMLECMAADATERPTFGMVSDKLKEIGKLLESSTHSTSDKGSASDRPSVGMVYYDFTPEGSKENTSPHMKRKKNVSFYNNNNNPNEKGYSKNYTNDEWLRRVEALTEKNHKLKKENKKLKAKLTEYEERA